MQITFLSFYNKIYNKQMELLCHRALEQTNK